MHDTYLRDTLSPLAMLLLLLFVRLVCALVGADQLLAQVPQLGVIHGDHALFKSVLSGVRPYYAAVLFTAVGDEHGCGICKTFDPVFATVALSWFRDRPELTQLFFFQFDFANALQAFRELGLTSVPHVWLYPPTTDKAFNPGGEHYAFQMGDAPSAMPFADFLSKVLNTRIVVHEPFDFAEFGQVFFMVLGGGYVIKKRAKKIASRFGSSYVWAAGVILAIAIFTGGFSYSLITNAPLVAYNKAETLWVARAPRSQFGLEVAIVAALYLALAAAVVLLVAVPSLELNQKYKNGATIVGVLAVYYLYATLTTLYGMKDGGYPYKLAELWTA